MNISRYDFAIVGAGSAGLIAADFAVKLGAKVVMLEKDRIGGDCTWTGCVPSKALLKVASVAHDVRTSGQYGVHTSQPVIDMPQVHAYLNSAIDQIYAGTTPEALQSKGMDVLLGPVSFQDRHTLICGERRTYSRKILISTGANPVVPSIQGLANVAKADGKVVGATMVGRRAGDALTDLVIAVERKLTLADLARVIHPYPTYSTGIQLLVTEMATAQATSGTSGKLLRAMSTLVR